MKIKGKYKGCHNNLLQATRQKRFLVSAFVLVPRP
jgi:hypothetical protein